MNVFTRRTSFTVSFAAAAILSLLPGAAEKPERNEAVKIYIHTELEGISGIDSMNIALS